MGQIALFDESGLGAEKNIGEKKKVKEWERLRELEGGEGILVADGRTGAGGPPLRGHQTCFRRCPLSLLEYLSECEGETHMSRELHLACMECSGPILVLLYITIIISVKAGGDHLRETPPVPPGLGRELCSMSP